MRDIRFRAWDESRKRMLTSAKWVDFRFNNKGELDAVNFSPKGGLQNLPIMQFTGLQDYEDVEMYEGDVVQVEGLGKCVVSICPYNGVTFHDLNDQITPIADCLAEQDQFRVIGNIHENPELLNKVK